MRPAVRSLAARSHRRGARPGCFAADAGPPTIRQELLAKAGNDKDRLWDMIV